jgi:type I restriction enzyme S subunit
MRDGWIETTLEDVAEVVMGQSPDGKSYNQSGEGLPFMQGSAEFGDHHPTPEKWCSDPKKIAEPGDLLLSVRAPVGDTNFANQRIAVGRGLSVIRANSKSLTEFIRFVIQLNVTEMIASSGSGMFASITGKNLKEFKVLLPPLPEQKRIVDLISSLDSYIEALQQQLESAKKSRKALLRELLAKGGNGWEKATLGDLVLHSIGGIWGEEQGGAEVDVPVYRQTEFSDSGILTTPAEAIRSVSKNQLKTRTLQENDILIQKSAGTPNLPGRVVSVPKLNEDVATFSNFLNLLRPNTEKCNPRLAFLIFWDKHQEGRAFEYQRGTNIKNLDLPGYLLETILIPPVPDQKRIVELISAFDDFLAQTNRSITLFEKLRSGLLSDLLSGEHQIPESYDTVMGAA